MLPYYITYITDIPLQSHNIPVLSIAHYKNHELRTHIIPTFSIESYYIMAWIIHCNYPHSSSQLNPTLYSATLSLQNPTIYYI